MSTKINGNYKHKITPFLWFDGNAEEAMNFYVSVFKNSKAGKVSRIGGENVISVTFELEGQEFIGLNGGPEFKFTEAISLFVHCDSQDEVDYLWKTLTADGGQESHCGWLKDKFGLSWQIIPVQLGKMLSDPDSEKSKRAMMAMLQMRKIDIKKLEQAYSGEHVL